MHGETSTKIGLKFKPPLIVIGSAFVLIPRINTQVLSNYIPIVLTIECRVVNKIWRRTPIPFNHVSLCYPFLDPHLTTHHSNISFQFRKATE